MSLPAELENLPAPTLVETLSYETTRAAFIARLKLEFDAVGFVYDVDMLETDPGVILMEVAGYVDTLLRARINDAIKSWFLAYAADGDLDVLAQWYDVARLASETDDALRRRIVLAIQGRSTGGTEERYRSIALGSDVRVADAAVYTEGRDPTINVAVFSTSSGGIASPDLLAIVNAALQSPSVRMVNDTIVVASAAQQTRNVVAKVWLLPDAPESTLATIEAYLRSSWAIDMLLGRDLTPSWLTAQLHREGVQRVELVGDYDVVIPFNQAAALGTVTLTPQGRDY